MIISPEAATLAVALAVIAGVILFIPVLQRILKLSAYIYCNAKIRALEAGLIRKDKYKELIDAKSEMECISAMEDTDYGKYLTRVPEPITAEKLEQALMDHIKDIAGKVLRSVPNEDKNIFKQYLKLWDVKNIKNILRGVWRSIPPEELEQNITPVGTLKESTLKALMESKNIDEAVSELESTEYGKVVSESFQEMAEDGTLLPIEAALDKHALEKLYTKAATSSDENLKVIQILIGTKADLTNLKTAIKAVAEEVLGEKIEKYLVDVYYKISQESMKAAIRAGSMDELANSIEGTEYSEVIGSELPNYRETESTFKLENALDKYFSKVAKDLSLRYPMGAGPALRLLVDKEKDVKKIGGLLKYKMERAGNVEDLNSIIGIK